MMILVLVITLGCFLCGSLLFSYWIGLLLNINIRSTGDGNPGAANLWKAAGYRFGMLGVVLDFLKGYVPVVLVTSTGLLSGYSLIPITLAPIVGHAFSPFLKFNGGKGLAVSFGVWSALTEFRASFCYAVILAVLFIITKVVAKGRKSTSHEDGLQTTVGLLLLSVYLMFGGYPAYMLWIWLGNFLLLLWKNKDGITRIIRDKFRKDRRYSKTG